MFSYQTDFLRLSALANDESSFFASNLFVQSFNLLFHSSFEPHYFLPFGSRHGTIKFVLSVDNIKETTLV